MTKRLQQIRFSLGAMVLVGAALVMFFEQTVAFAAPPAAAPPGGATSQSKPAAAAPQLVGSEADEKAIRATADVFVKAFNASDAQAIGDLWAADARYTDESGQSYYGGPAIEKEYATLFKEHRGATMTVNIDSIRFLGPDIAIEKGIATVKLPGAEAASGARYTVVHARRDGKWIMVVGRDAPYVPGTDGDSLKDLGWLIGDWQVESQGRTLQLHFEWMAQRNFIKNTFLATRDGKSILTGGQIIGWNPKLGHIVSWHFGAEGGFGNDVWIKKGSKWLIDASGVLHDGSESSAVNVLAPLDANSFTWQSLERTLDGVSLPDTPVVKMVRVGKLQASK